MYVCHIDGIPIGTRRSFDIAGESVIVTHDRDGDVQAFANVCRHRGAELCPVGGEASKGNIRCSYHAWTYGLDGALVATPRVDDEFDRDEYGLWPRHAEVWNGLVFVSVAAEPPALIDWLTTWTPGIERLRRRADRRLSPRRAHRSRWSPPTGRSWSRTTTSACTAPSCTPSWST